MSVAPSQRIDQPTARAARSRPLAMVSIAVPMFLAALDQTVVSTALPRVARELGGLDWYAWVFTAYMLATAATVPVAGRLGDLRGRRSLLVAGTVLFALGSFAAGAVSTMFALVLTRVLQGVGAGVISANAFSTAADLYTPAERGRVMGSLSAVYALAGMVGPLMGGGIADTLGWRWVFWVNVPIGAIAVASIAATVPPAAPREKNARIDVAGAVALVATVVPFLAALARDREGSAVPAAARMPLLLTSLVMGIAFLAIERRAESPVVPLELFRRPVFASAIAVAFFAGTGLYACGVFLPLFLQTVQHVTGTRAGLVLAPLPVSIVAAAVVSGRWITRSGKYRRLTVAGLFVATLGEFAMSRVTPGISHRVLMVEVALTGLGFGLTLPSLSIAAQNAVEDEHLGVSTAMTSFGRQVGGTIGVALLGWVLSTQAAHGMTVATSHVFVAAAGINALALVAVISMRDLPLRRTRGQSAPRESHEGEFRTGE